MPSEHLHSQSQSQSPALATQRTITNSGSDSPHGSPHGKANRVHSHKHVVGAGRGIHARVPSSKGLHKATGSKTHIATEDSHTDLKKLSRNSSATSLKKNSSHVSLKRNRSAADILKRPKSSHGQHKRPTSVHFEIGDQDQDQDQDEAWEEASNSASPALSRAVSSGKASANTSGPQSPARSPPRVQRTAVGPSGERNVTRGLTADAKAITQRLLQRTPSHNTTKMSLATATPDTSTHHGSDSPEKSQSSVPNGTPKIGSGAEVVSRFVGGSGTPSEHSPSLQSRRMDTAPRQGSDEVKRAQSMGNLTRADSDGEDGEESALAPRSRKSSTSHYIPPQTSRTQQKLWLQRASSNMEPQQMAPGLTSLHSGSSLVGAGIDGRDPRIKIQLEKTGLEYLVVRRYQDPVGKALKRLSQLPGAEKNRRIPPQNAKKGDSGSAGRHGHGLSQSLNQNRMTDQTPPANGGAGSSYGDQSGNSDDASMSGRADGDDGVGAILRSMWEKSSELSASAD